MIQLLSCLNWSFRARDFSDIEKLDLFAKLYRGFNQVQNRKGDGKRVEYNFISKKRREEPLGRLVTTCDSIVENLFLSLMARLAEPGS